MLELEKLKKEKTETELARKTAEDQVESTRKDHEAKVHIFVTFTDLINGDNYERPVRFCCCCFFRTNFNKFHTQLFTVTIRL